MFKLFFIAPLVAALVGCSTTPKDVIADASKAMGGDNLKSIEYTASGFSYALGQAPNPNAPWPKFNAKMYKREINFETPASRQTLVRTQAENPPRGGGNQPIVGENTATVV